MRHVYSGRRGGRGRGRGGGRGRGQSSGTQPSKEQLDAELDAYNSKVGLFVVVVDNDMISDVIQYLLFLSLLTIV